jgi:hypothetical protein
MTESNPYFWAGFAHQQLYDEIHGKAAFSVGDGAGVSMLRRADGAGVSGATEAQDGWAHLAELMNSARARTEDALERAGAVWEGDAADSMHSGVSPLAAWAAQASTASTASQSSVDDHVAAYIRARDDMPKPEKVTSTANSDWLGMPRRIVHLFGGQTDQDVQEAEAQEAKWEAVRIMSRFESESGMARSGVGGFVPPPSVAVTVPPPQPKAGEIPTSTTELADPGHPADNRTRSASDTGAGTRAPAGAPAPAGIAGPPSGTTPSATQPAPVNIGTLPSTTNTPPAGPDLRRPGPGLPLPASGNLAGEAPGGRGVTGSIGRGPAGGPGSARPGGGPEARPGAGRGPLPGTGAGGAPVSGRSAGPGSAGTRGNGGMGAGPIGGQARGDDDTEHSSPEYLRSTHDDFWRGNNPVAPPVIGDDRY